MPSIPLEERAMIVGRRPILALLVGLLMLRLSPAVPAAAQDQNGDIGYFGTNTLVFEPVGAVSPDASGKGIIDYQGGDEPQSQWRATFRFNGLEPDAAYTVVVKGRFGDPGSPDASAMTPICSFQADADGKGNCFWYFRGLARLNLVQLRAGDETGARVLQASRDGNPGSITTDPNRYSPGGVVSDRKRQSAAETK
jgi:hypothetical protein